MAQLLKRIQGNDTGNMVLDDICDEIIDFINGKSLSLLKIPNDAYASPDELLIACLCMQKNPAAALHHISPINGNNLLSTALEKHSGRTKFNDSYLCFFKDLLAELFEYSNCATHQAYLNLLEGKRFGKIHTLFQDNHNGNIAFINFLECTPRLIFLVEKYFQLTLGPSWNCKKIDAIIRRAGATVSRRNNAYFESTRLDSQFGQCSGLEFYEEQTFGVEIEITSSTFDPEQEYAPIGDDDATWKEIANSIIALITDTVETKKVCQTPIGYHDQISNRTDVWLVEHDCSVGWEIVSPKMKGLDDLLDLKKVLEALSEFLDQHDFLCINYRCGLHLNLGLPLFNNNEWHHFLSRYLWIEPALMPYVSPARVLLLDAKKLDYTTNENNNYCTPVSFDEHLIKEKFEIDPKDVTSGTKYSSIHFHPGNKTNTIQRVEVRLHNGTVNYVEVFTWLALWMRILRVDEIASSFAEPPAYDFSGERIDSREDLLKALDQKNISINQTLKRLLHKKRCSMKLQWKYAYTNKYRYWESLGIYN